MKKAKKWIVCTLLCTLCLQNASFAAEPSTEASALPAAPIPAASIAVPSLPTLSTTSRPSVTRASFEQGADTATLPASGGKLRITLFLGSENRPDGYGQIRVKAVRKEKGDPASPEEVLLLPPEDVDSSQKKGKRIFSISLPENTKDTEQEITLFFNCLGSEDEFQDEPSLSITQEKSAESTEEKSKITGFKVNKNALAKGGQIRLNVKGENLTADSLFGKVYREENGARTELPELSAVLSSEWDGLDSNRSTFLSLPDSEDGSSVQYLLEVGLKSDPNHPFPETQEVLVGGKESRKTVSFQPRLVAASEKGKKVTLYFYENIAPAKDMESLKKAIFLKEEEGAPYTSLTEKDEIAIPDAHTLVLRLANEHHFQNTAKLKVEEHAIVDSVRQFENNSFESFIRSDRNGVISEAHIEEGSTLSEEGGTVQVLVKGQNLSKESFRLKVIPNKLFSGDAAENVFQAKDLTITEIKSTNTEEGNKGQEEDSALLLRFSIPKNETKYMRSFTLRLSADNGKTFQNRFSKTALPNEKLVISQLFKGQDPTLPALSFASIQSYGTSGGGTEVVDNTHTNTPIGQESKKTLVHLYGVNLDEKKSKIKIVDENGISWYPVNDATSDSASNFIMIAFNHTGITGNGNSQVMEVICPNNFKGDRTFTYSIAADGVHYDSAHTVTATVLDDQKSGKKELSPRNLRNSKVSFTDTKGNLLEDPEYTPGYNFSKAISFGIAPKNIDGYTVKRYRFGEIQNKRMHWTEEDIGRLDGLNIGNIAELQFIYEKAEAEPPTASGKNQSGNASGASGLTGRRTEPRSASLSTNSGKQAAVLGESRDRVLEGAWKEEEKGWWFSASDGSYPKASWEKILYQGKPQWFFFNDEGYMATGWILDKGKWYYLNPQTGAMHEGWLFWQNDWYYLTRGSGEMKTETTVLDGKTYVFDRVSGKLQ